MIEKFHINVNVLRLEHSDKKSAKPIILLKEQLRYAFSCKPITWKSKTMIICVVERNVGEVGIDERNKMKELLTICVDEERLIIITIFPGWLFKVNKKAF